MWGDSLVWNQYSHRVDAEVKFYKYKFLVLFLEVFWKQHQSRFALSSQMIYKLIYLNLFLDTLSGVTDWEAKGRAAPPPWQAKYKNRAST